MVEGLHSQCEAMSSNPSTTKKKKKIKPYSCWAWWHMPIISAFGRLGQEDYEFEISLGYAARPYHKRKNKTNKQKSYF
jgi:hypothetical protein